MKALTVGNIYVVFNPRYGTFTGKLVYLCEADGEAEIEHEVMGVTCNTVCNLVYCSFDAPKGI